MERNEILNNLGIASLSEMQKATSDAFLSGRGDVVVLSPTGSGKTLAYLLPLVEQIDITSDTLQAIVVVPGRELAMQSARVLASMKCGVRGYACYGGRAAMDEHRELRTVLPHIIFATPGRLNDHIDKDNISVLHVATAVIDEFDKCLDMGFEGEMMKVMRKLRFASRRILLSATNAETIPNFIDISHARYVDFLDASDVSTRIQVQVLRSPVNDKLETLFSYLCTVGDVSTIVFVNYRESVERVEKYLAENGFAVSAFHGGLDQQQREDALYKFTNKSANIMVCTDLGSRGLDIDDVANVVHYHLPETHEAYIHRIGRTARWNADGNAMFILGPKETLPEYVTEYTEAVLPDTIPQPSLPKMSTIYIGKGKKDKISRGDIVGFLCKKGGLQPGDIGKIDVKERYAYVAVKRDTAERLLARVKNEKIKGVKTIFELVR